MQAVLLTVWLMYRSISDGTPSSVSRYSTQVRLVANVMNYFFRWRNRLSGMTNMLVLYSALYMLVIMVCIKYTFIVYT